MSNYQLSINNYQLPEGYKQTEVGVIPEDWVIRSCSEISERIVVGIVIRPTQYYATQGVPAFRSANIREDGITNSDLVFISESSNALLAKSQTRAGDILTVRTGYPGTSAVVRPQHEGCNCIDILITRPSQKLVNSDYLAIWINSSFGKDQVLRNQGGLAQKHFNVGDMKELLVALPKPEEQRAIAATLSDVDALIAALDKLISKQRHLKTATMQQLLTGKKRLPGFGEGKGYKQTEVGVIPEDWDVKHLSQLISNLEAGVSVNSTDEENNGYENEPSVLKTSSVFNGNFSPNECKRIAARDIRRAKLNPQKETIIISRMNTPALVGECGYVGEDYNNLFLPDRLWITRFNKESHVSAKWLSCILSYGHFNKAIKDTATGTSGSMKNIAKNAFLQLSIPYPSGEEQRAIATVLSDMDTAISALETRRAKTQAIKQGMMQELLTGRTRLG